MSNKDKYIQYCLIEKKVPIFSQPWWLDIVTEGGDWNVCLVEKGGEIVASMPYIVTRKFVFKVCVMPILTQTLGPYIKYPKGQKYYKKLSWEKNLMEGLIKELPNVDYFSQNFDKNITNWLPFYWHGFKQTTRYSYVIENITLNDLESGFETDIRRRRKKARNMGVKVYESEDVLKFYELNKMTYTRKNKDIPYEFDFIKNVYCKCKENNSCKMLFAENIDGQVIAGNFLIYDETTVYYLMGGIDPTQKNLGGMDAVQFESIKFALESGKKFDFEGSMVESIEKYFRSFGAIQKTYFSITKTSSFLLHIRSLFF